MGETLELFTDTLNDVASGPHVGGFAALTEALMRRFAEKGFTLAQLSDRRMMNRSVRTLQEHARTYDLQFPDYVPRKLKPKKSKPEKGSTDGETSH